MQIPKECQPEARGDAVARGHQPPG